MGIRFVIGGCVAILLYAAAADEVCAGTAPSLSEFVLQQTSADDGSEDEARIYKWEKDLRWWTFRLLKDVRRYSIRLSRLIQRSAVYWAGWVASATMLLLYGGLVSAVDRRLLALAWQRGARVAASYAWIGLVVFLRLLRDRRVSGRLRLMVPLALLYSIISSTWLDTGLRVLDLTDEFLVVGLASRWFVRRCPDAIIEQHAAHARERAPAIPVSSERG